MDKGKVSDGPLFRAINPRTHRPMKKGIREDNIRKIIKIRCKAAGIEGRVLDRMGRGVVGMGFPLRW